MIRSLVNYYEVLAKENKVPKPGWSIAKVSLGVDLSEEGKVLGFIPLTVKTERGKKVIYQPQSLKVPEQVTRASGISPNFLCDNSSYIFGIDTKGKPERAKECFRAAKEKHLEILRDVHSFAAEAVKAFFQNWDPEETENNTLINEYYEEICGASNLIFILDGDYIHEDPEISISWEKAYNQKEDCHKGICLATGDYTNISRIHGSIKGVPGAQTSGATLIGFNEPSFLSYGKKQSYNAPVGEYAVYAYTTALNYLINSRNGDYYKYRTTLGETIILYWSEDGNEMYQKCFRDVTEPTVDNQEIIDGMFKNLEKGWDVDTEGVLEGLSPKQKFFVLGISPNAARLSVRFFYQDSFGNILQHLKEHYDRMDIVRSSKDTIGYLGTWRMLQEIVNKKSRDKKPPGNLGGTVLKAILSGGRYPESLYQAVLRRIRAEQDDKDSNTYKITRGRAAIIKACLIRNTNVSEQEEITVSLNEHSKNIPYTLGRMFAVLENIQEESSGNSINSTIKDRYFNSACATPASIFPILLKLKNSHMKKVGRSNKGLEVHFEQMLGKLQNCIQVEDNQNVAYPKRLSLEEQGMFILGYYHQTQKRYEKKKEEEK